MPEFYVFQDGTTQRLASLDDDGRWRAVPAVRDWNEKGRPTFVHDTEAGALALLQAADAGGGIDWTGEGNH